MENLQPWMVLLSAPKLGSVQLLRLLEKFTDVGKIVTAGREELIRAGLATPTIEHILRQNHPGLKLQLSWLQQPDNHIVTIQDAAYPPLLKKIADPPAALFISGSLSLLKKDQIAIVGSRNPTETGRKTARLFASQLADLDLVITSGLATGIDSCAHHGAIEADGKTIAVLGNGPDIVYPARNRNLYRAIREKGALLSEYLPGTPPLAAQFPQRNRIISGLCKGVLVVEAAIRSGSLITARLANEYGREVFALPGSVYNPLSRGCHHLIKQGAKLTETVIDVVEELDIDIAECESGSANNADSYTYQGNVDHPGMQLLLDHMGYDPVTINSLIENTGLTAETVSSMLCLLEVAGKVSSQGGFYTRIN